jgi:outer membrane protein assembly factor BamB
MGKIWLGLLAIACALAVASPPEVDQWPQYRGRGGAGIADGAAPVEFGPNQNLLWSVAVKAGHSSPSIWGERVFLTGFDASARELEVIALDRRDGHMLWRRVAPAPEIEKVHAVSNPATATVAVDPDRVYAYFGSAGMFCYDHAGKPVWNRPQPVAKVSFGSGISPLLAGDAVILARDDSESHILALDRKTGKTLWDEKLEHMGMFAGHSSPVAWKDQVLLHRAGEIVAFDINTGARKWWIRVTSQGTGTPVVDGDLLFVGAWGADPDLRDPVPSWDELIEKYDRDGSGSLSKEEFPADLAIARRVDAGQTPGAVVTFRQFFGQLDMNKDGQVSKAEWEFVSQMIAQPMPYASGLLAIRLGGEKDMSKQSVVWSEPRGVPEVPVPLVYRGHVYAVTNGGIVSLLDQTSGKLVYRGRLGAGGLYYASPVAAGDHVYFASGEGVVSVVKAGDKLDVVARNDLAEPIFATPAVVNGKLYIRTTAHLYAFGR